MSANGPITQIPNLISLARLLAVPVTVYLILEQYHAAAFWVFAVASASDALDGFIAKRFSIVSEIGSYLDPLADKALLVGVYIALGHMEHVAIWLVFLIVFRDLIIIGGAILFHTLTHSLKMEPLFISKVNTAVQFALATVILAEIGLGIPLSELSAWLVYIVAASTFLSGAAYVIKWGWLAVLMERDK